MTSRAIADVRSIEVAATPPAITAAIPMPLSTFVDFTCIIGLHFRCGSSVAPGFSQDTSRSVRGLRAENGTTHSATRRVRVGVRP
jgi:hypothetical protein